MNKLINFRCLTLGECIIGLSWRYNTFKSNFLCSEKHEISSHNRGEISWSRLAQSKSIIGESQCRRSTDKPSRLHIHGWKTNTARCKLWENILDVIKLNFHLLQRRQKRRVMFQRELAQKIVTGSWEIDYAVDRHKKVEEEKVKEKQRILQNKLKPKGHLLLKKKWKFGKCFVV